MQSPKPSRWGWLFGEEKKEEVVDPITEVSQEIAPRETHAARVNTFLAGIEEDDRVADNVIGKCNVLEQGHKMNLSEAKTLRLQTEAGIKEVNEGVQRIQKISAREVADPEFPADHPISITGREIKTIPTPAQILGTAKTSLEHGLSRIKTIIDRENQNVERIDEVRDRAQAVKNTGANLRTSLTIAKTLTEAGITPEDFATAIKELVEKRKEKAGKAEEN